MPRAFLIMPFDPAYDGLQELVRGAATDVNIDIERADDIFAAGVVIEQIKERLASADVVVAVCTGRNANVFYELGIAEHYHEPVLLAESPSDLPFDVQHRRALLYGEGRRGHDATVLRADVSRALVETIADRSARLNRYLDEEPVARRFAEEARRLASPQPRGEIDADLRLRDRGSYVLEVRNSGPVDLTDVSWEIPSAARWHDLKEALPAYPIPLLPAGDRVRVPVATGMGSQTATLVVLHALTTAGEEISRQKMLSIY